VNAGKVEKYVLTGMEYHLRSMSGWRYTGFVGVIIMMLTSAKIVCSQKESLTE
jgi:hypothetical protein